MSLPNGGHAPSPPFACCLGAHALSCERPRAPLPQSGNSSSGGIATTASALEDSVCSRLVHRDAANNADGNSSNRMGVAEGDGDDDPVQIFVSEDAHLLRCRPVHPDDGSTIFGIAERAASLGENGSIPVHLSVLEPRCDEKRQDIGCICLHPRGNWNRRRSSQPAMNGNAQRSSSYRASVDIIDLTTMQEHRRMSTGSKEQYPSFDAPGKVLHLLRSVLCSSEGGLHCASPWNHMYCTDNSANNDNHPERDGDQVVALLIKDAKQNNGGSGDKSEDEHFWDGVEEREANELLHFRTGDAAPSYFLHSATPLLRNGERDFVADLQEAGSVCREGKTNASSSSNALLLVYRRLPPRDVLAQANVADAERDVGCLQETYLEDAKESESDNIGLDPAPVVKQRMVSPPYLSHAHEFPGLLDELLDGIDAIREEAQRIPQWTAWPEQTHYAENSWNVFPLCYTFPADDLSHRMFIHKTCAFVPETTRLLHTLGPTLRTALFSRLDPRASLGAHTGWSDLANHVLRVHVPLIVPRGKGSEGLCGTWVDGCVETHDEGRVVCFDDSKVHRAFNFSDEERIVLIIDLLRPPGLPKGTATGGHSEELDAFIESI
ncbi:hypothetical protein ACHAXT_010037 [Thalassiosira profunda]